MKDIKFRCWHNEAKPVWNIKKTIIIAYEAGMIYDAQPGDCLVWKNNKQNIESIMQFTGLYDKNGKEIYDGDILQEEYAINSKVVKSRPQLVTWIDNDACFGLKPSNPFEYTQLTQRDGKQGRRYIIGNIHENKELV